MDILNNEELADKIGELIYENAGALDTIQLIATVSYYGRLHQVHLKVTTNEDDFIGSEPFKPQFRMLDNGLEAVKQESEVSNG